MKMPVPTSRTLLLLPFLLLPTSTKAFQAELITQVLQAASNLADPATAAVTTAPLDELLFVAANLLDTSSKNQQRGPLLLPPSPRRRRISLSVQFPEVYQGQSTNQLYDYDTHPVCRTISLSQQEEALFDLIRAVRNKYSPATTIRVAGGWVRDKLLYDAAPSRDIDFVLSDVSGSDFAKLVCRYLEEENDRGIIDDGNNKCDDVRLTMNSKKKGLQSDHLQTATLSILGFDVDFCRLRYEKYDGESRIPERTGVASVVQDAWRRDLTINSLYYNINTRQVEDWTEQAVPDLQLRTIATPRSALPTLLEDPIRILRAIRFAAQLSFSMDSALIRAARDVRVRFALQSKVSRDGIGGEVDALFSTRDPTRGIKLLMETNLIDLVFPQYGKAESKAIVEQEEAEPLQPTVYYDGLDLLSRTQALVSRIFTQAPQWNVSNRRKLWYAAFFKPLYEATASSKLSKRDRRRGSAFYRLLTDGLKRPRSDIQSIESILKGVEALNNLIKGRDIGVNRAVLHSDTSIRDISQDDDEWKELSDLRWTFYKTMKPIGPLWKEALILALASSKDGLSESVNKYDDWVTLIEEQLNLGNTLRDKSNMKPLLNGSQIQERALRGVCGEGFKHIMKAQEEWQVRNCYSPDAVDNSGKLEAQLIDNLIERFPEYASNKEQ